MQTICHASAGSLARSRVEALLASGGQLIDLRSPAEFKQHSIPGSLNLPMDSLSYEHKRLSTRRAVIVYGASEVRCARAAQLLAGKGFLRIYHLAASHYRAHLH